MLSPSNKKLKEEMLWEQTWLSQQIMSINQQMQAYFQMQQTFGSRSQQQFINSPQNDKLQNKDEGKNRDEEYDYATLGDWFFSCSVLASLFHAYVHLIEDNNLSVLLSKLPFHELFLQTCYLRYDEKLENCLVCIGYLECMWLGNCWERFSKDAVVSNWLKILSVIVCRELNILY